LYVVGRSSAPRRDDLATYGAFAVGIVVAAASCLTWIRKKADPTESVPDEPTGTPHEVTGYFTGRAKEWRHLKALVRATADRKRVRAVIMIHGMPGAGKTQFAYYATQKFNGMFSRRARRLGLKMEFRTIDLGGQEGSGRADPGQRLLAALHADSRFSAMNLDDVSEEWRRYLYGRFLILVLDNAVDTGQVLPFLPGESWYVVLVTGRRELRDLAVHGVQVQPFPLGVLEERDAVKLVKKIAGRTLRKDDRQVVKEMVQLCGYLPLAITVATTQLLWNRNISFSDLLARLKKNPNTLLAIEEYAEESGSVAKVFEVAYTQLPDECKLVLRRLGLSPSLPTIGVKAAAALADIPDDAAAADLSRLRREALIEEVGDSYRLHDLIRHYAMSLAERDDPAENEAALSRLLAYYHAGVSYVDSLLTRQPPPQAIDPPAPTVAHDFAGPPSAIAWARAELPNLLACADYVVRRAQESGRREENTWVILFSGALAGFLRNEGRWPRSLELQTQAISAAEQIHLPLAAANALGERAMLHRLMSELEMAVADLQKAITIYREIGGVAGETGEAHALDNYGVVLDQLKQQAAARQKHDQALDIYRRLNNRLGEANVLQDQGMTELFSSNYEKAIDLFSQALDIYQAIDQPLGKAHAHAYLARAQRNVGLELMATKNLESAHDLYHYLGNQLGEVTTLIQLGSIRGRHNRHRAIHDLREALDLSNKIGNQIGVVNSLDELAELRRTRFITRRYAVKLWMRALGITRKYGLQRDEAKLLEKLKRLGLLNEPANADN
jgi:tetratricopeptide (TPR) repeat protein